MARAERWAAAWPRVVPGLHLFALSGVAIALPLFGILQPQTTFFVAHKASPSGVVALVLLALVVPPAVVAGVVGLVRLLSRRAARWTLGLSVGLLAALAAVLPATRALELSLRATAAALVLGTGLFARLYLDWRAARQFLTFLVPAPVVMGLLFLSSADVRPIVFPDPSPAAAVEPGHTPPVVVLLFDELSLATMLDESGAIDAERFPNFARLAELATWYPEATTVGNATHLVVPSILTGRRPPSGSEPLPLPTEYPDNLFSLLDDSYDVEAWEFITDLCDGLCNPRRASDFGTLVEESGILYLHGVLPRDVSARFLPPLEGHWAGFAQEKACRTCDFDDFLAAIGPAERPTLWYMHTPSPHTPWARLPTGQSYADAMPIHWYTTGGWPDSEAVVDHARQRYLLQARDADRQLGALLDRLAEVDLLDEALLVVAADHGLHFAPGEDRRAVTGDGLAGTLPVPLFVKPPGGTRGVVDRRNAQTVDLLPTIADVLDVDLPWSVDGASLLGPGVGPPEKYAVVDGERLAVPGHIDTSAVVEAFASAFGEGGGADDTYAFGPHAGLVGRPIEDLEVAAGEQWRRARVPDLADYEAVDTAAAELPAAELRASLGVGAAVRERWVAAAVNGVVAGVGHTYDAGGEHRVAVMVSPRHLQDGHNEVALFLVGDDGTLEPLDVTTGDP